MIISMEDFLQLSIENIKSKLMEGSFFVEDSILYHIQYIALHTEEEKEMLIYCEKEHPSFVFAKFIDDIHKDKSLCLSFTDRILHTPNQINGVYTHYKNKDYHVINTVYDVKNDDFLTLYQALYGEYRYFVRPFDMFHEKINVNGKMLKRFTYKV